MKRFFAAGLFLALFSAQAFAHCEKNLRDLPEGEEAPSLEVRDGTGKRDALLECAIRNAILFTASNAVNTAFALQAKWKSYAGEGKGLEGILETPTWARAWADPEFRHNMAFNALFMLGLGIGTCSNNPVQARNWVAGLAGATSMMGQFLTSGEISLRQTLLDMGFCYFISWNKTRYVIAFDKWYARRGLPMRHAIHLVMQLLSESSGSWLYPRTVTGSKWLWPDARDIRVSLLSKDRQPSDRRGF